MGPLEFFWRLHFSVALRIIPMPYINVRLTRKDITTEQKAQIVREITATMQSVLGKRPESVHVVIDEVDPENWGYAGELTSVHRQRQG